MAALHPAVVIGYDVLHKELHFVGVARGLREGLLARGLREDLLARGLREDLLARDLNTVKSHTLNSEHSEIKRLLFICSRAKLI